MMRILLALCLLSGWVPSAVGESGGEPVVDSSPAAPEYQKLWDIVKAKRAPVKGYKAELDIGKSPAIGSRNAEVVLVEFGDYQCHFCRQHLLDTAPQIRQDFVLNGQLLYVFADIPVQSRHPLAARSAEAARCAGEQGKYWEMRNYLYTNQKALHELLLVGYAKYVGIEEDAYRACFNSMKYAGTISGDQRLSESLGVKGTPAFFLGLNVRNGEGVRVLKRISGARPYAVFAKEIREMTKLTRSDMGGG